MSRKQSKPTTKSKIRPSNLPQHDLPAPYSRLLTLGEGDFASIYDTVAHAMRESDPETAAARLVQMVLDKTYQEYEEDDPRVWTDLHALRVLMRMGAAAQAGIEPLLPLLNSDDDYLREEIPFYYAEMGQAAIEPLARIVRDDTADEFLRSGASESLAEIGEKTPELRPVIVPILEETLLVEQEETVAAFLVCNLLDLGALDSMAIIEKAFEEERVDESVVCLADVQEHFGLPVTAERPEWDYAPTDSAVSPGKVEIGRYKGADLEDKQPSQPYVAPAKVGRNDLCPCGSGKKYKKCCGAAT